MTNTKAILTRLEAVTGADRDMVRDNSRFAFFAPEDHPAIPDHSVGKIKASSAFAFLNTAEMLALAAKEE